MNLVAEYRDITITSQTHTSAGRCWLRYGTEDSEKDEEKGMLDMEGGSEGSSSDRSLAAQSCGCWYVQGLFLSHVVFLVVRCVRAHLQMRSVGLT